MKRLLGLVLIAGLLSVSASAQEAQLWPDTGDGLNATFYNGDPFDGGELVETDFRVALRDTSVGKAIHLDSGADHVLISVGGLELAFETEGVTNTSSTRVTAGEGETLLLAEVVASLHDASEGETNLAVFTDGGVVTGFYEFSQGHSAPIAVDEADQLIVATADGANVFEVISAEVSRLGNVSVAVDEGSMTLSRLGVM